MKIISNQPFISSQLTALLSVPSVHLTLKRCNDGELLACADKSLIHKQKVVIVHVLENPVNSSLMDLLIMIDAVKSAQPEYLTLVLPYYAYGRQDHPAHDNAGSAAQLVMRLLATAGIDQLVTVDSHNPNVLKEAPFKVRELTAIPLFAELIRAHNLAPIVIAPDQGATERAKILAKHLNTDWAVLNKKRLENGDIVIDSLTKDIKNRDCVIIDDIIDSGKTLCLAAAYLKREGANRIDAYVTHGLFGNGCLARLEQSSLQSLTITNTMPLNSISLSPKVTCVDITSILIEDLKVRRLNHFV